MAIPTNEIEAIELITGWIDEQGLDRIELPKFDSDELAEKLEKIDQLINSPEVYPYKKLKDETKQHLKDTRRFVAELIEHKQSINRIVSIPQLVMDKIESADLEEVIHQVEKVRDSFDNMVRHRIEVERELKQFQAENARKMAQLNADIADARAKRQTRFFRDILDKEMIATLVGALLIVILTTFLIILSANNPQGISAELKHTFFIVLGYFFGQSVNHRLHPVNQEATETS